jgi:hypothetical protein
MANTKVPVELFDAGAGFTIGSGAAEDTKIVFDGNAQDFYIGLDDSADDLIIGKGSTVGTTPAISVDENQKVTFTKDIEVQADSVSGSEGGHITLRAASGGSKEFGIDVDSSNNLRIITEDDGTGDNGAAHVYVTNTGNILLNNTTSLIGVNTSDGSDNKSVMINGGGAASDSRGAYVWIKGNEHSDAGFLQLNSGNLSGAGIKFFTAGSEKIRINESGNLLVNSTSDNTGVSGGGIRQEIGSSETDGDKYYVAQGGGSNATPFVLEIVGQNLYDSGTTAMKVGRHSGNQRSISAGGTLNASGADYAEYMKKTDSCGTIAKGDVVGVDANGKLTKTFSDSINFVIKSTDPSYVGGDTWGSVDLNLTEEQYETERQKYDRIAFSGQVPVNITGSFNVGDYVYPQANGTEIQAVAKSTPTFEEYQLCVGKIWATEDDGRPLVAVKIG